MDITSWLAVAAAVWLLAFATYRLLRRRRSQGPRP
jgi:hypothetical protein